jgi:hypothetical protein
MNATFLVVFVLHVLCAALWVGVGVIGALFLTPAARDMGPDGVKMMLALRKRGFVAFVPIIAAITILSGFWLYWRYTAGFSAEVVHSHAGAAFGIGGLTGVLSFIIGGAVISRNLVQAMRLGTEAAALPEGRDRADRLARAQVLRQRAASAGNLVGVLLVVTVILMVIARYL